MLLHLSLTHMSRREPRRTISEEIKEIEEQLQLLSIQLAQIRQGEELTHRDTQEQPARWKPHFGIYLVLTMFKAQSNNTILQALKKTLWLYPIMPELPETETTLTPTTTSGIVVQQV
jgi:hypothetical protein